MQVQHAQHKFSSAIAKDPRKYLKLDVGVEDPNVEDDDEEEWKDFYDDEGDENIEAILTEPDFDDKQECLDLLEVL